MKRRENQKPDTRSMRYMVVFLGLAVLAWMVMDFNARMAELHRLSEEKESVGAQLLSYTQTNEALKGQITYATSEAAVVQWAYEDAHMSRPGDIPVVPFSSGEVTPTPVPTRVVTQTETSNLEKWMALFWGPSGP